MEKNTFRIGFLFSLLLISFLIFGCINLNVGSNPFSDSGSGVIQTPNHQKNITSNLSIGDEQQNVAGGASDEDNTTIDENDGGASTYTPKAPMSIYFIDVATGDKQGEAILFKKGDFEMLFDSGPKESAQTVINFLNGRVEGDLDLVILSHNDEEHIGSISEIINNFKVDKIMLNKKSDSNEYGDLIKYLESKTDVEQINKGDVINLNGATAEVMNPDKSMYSNDEGSVTMKISYNAFSLILLSDTVFSSQSKMINDYDLNCNVLEIADHGLGGGNTNLNLLFQHTSPKYVVMTGNKNLGQKSKKERDATFQQIEWEGAKVYSTFQHDNDIGGTVKVSTDGSSYTIIHIS